MTEKAEKSHRRGSSDHPSDPVLCFARPKARQAMTNDEKIEELEALVGKLAGTCRDMAKAVGDFAASVERLTGNVDAFIGDTRMIVTVVHAKGLMPEQELRAVLERAAALQSDARGMRRTLRQFTDRVSALENT